MKSKYHILLLLAATLLLPSCATTSKQKPMVTTTVTRSASSGLESTSRSLFGHDTGATETVTTQAPYESPAFQTASEGLWK